MESTKLYSGRKIVLTCAKLYSKSFMESTNLYSMSFVGSTKLYLEIALGQEDGPDQREIVLDELHGVHEIVARELRGGHEIALVQEDGPDLLEMYSMSFMESTKLYSRASWSPQNCTPAGRWS